MEYNSILSGIEEQKRQEHLSAQLFRYAGLIQAIEFFSQKLNFEQIIDAGFDFINELVTIEKSAVFVIQGHNYVLKKLKGYDGEIISIKNNDHFQSLATLHGNLLYEKELLESFFDTEVLEAYRVATAIPLIIENNLYGFIFISDKVISEQSSDDFIISAALMKLINNALENYKRYEELQKANKELDEKIFNLFAINQSSKALLSELSLDVLYNLSVDVFSELTQNMITGFVLYDDKYEKYLLKAYKDIFYKELDLQVSLTINKKARVDVNKVLIKMSDERDVQYFNSLFSEGIQSLAELKCQYIVLLIKSGKVLGFVTLGPSVTGIEYKNSMFELIESLSSATYIAVSNAQLFKQVSEQKRIIHGKLEKLLSLNNLMKNINSSTTVDGLVDITLKTLDISFHVEKAMICLYDKQKEVFTVKQGLGLNINRKEIKINEQWKKIMEGDSIFEAKEEGVLRYLDKAMVEDIGPTPGILIIPIYIDRMDAEILGAMIVFKSRKVPINDEETLLTLETIAGHIAPVLSNLFTIEEQKRFLLPNYIELFKNDLKTEIAEANDFFTDLAVVQIIDNRSFVFKGNTIVDKLKGNFKLVYPFSYNNIFIIIKDKDKNIEKKIKRFTGVEDIVIRRLEMRKDFKGFQDFFKLF